MAEEDNQAVRNLFENTWSFVIRSLSDMTWNMDEIKWNLLKDKNEKFGYSHTNVFWVVVFFFFKL